jgi:hypothetical protein
MNIITVTGGKPRQNRYVESMVQFCIKMLMPRMKTLDITVKLCSPKGALGYCLAEDKRTFEIEVDRTLRLRRLLETVAHEMVHVKQYARDELHVDYANCWKNDFYTKTDYWDCPWEIEAHGRELGLFIRWAELHKLGHKKWTRHI